MTLAVSGQSSYSFLIIEISLLCMVSRLELGRTLHRKRCESLSTSDLTISPVRNRVCFHQSKFGGYRGDLLRISKTFISFYSIVKQIQIEFLTDKMA